MDPLTPHITTQKSHLTSRAPVTRIPSNVFHKSRVCQEHMSKVKSEDLCYIWFGFLHRNIHPNVKVKGRVH